MALSKSSLNIIKEDIASINKSLQNDFSNLEGSSILITGAAGFVCSYLVDAIAYLNETKFKDFCKIIAVDNFITGFPHNLRHLKNKPYIKVINRDVSGPFKAEPVEYVVHGASIASPAFYRKHPFETMNVNVNGTWKMLDFARKHDVKSFVYMSSSEVYGDPLPGFIPTPEDYRGNVSCTGPRACYDESKRFGETLSINYYNTYKLPVKITRTFNVYGPRLHLNDKRVIPDLLSNALANQNITLYSDGKATRSFCYIADAIPGYLKVLSSKFDGEVFNVGNDQEEVSMTNLAKLIIGLTNPKLRIVYKKSPEKEYLTDNPQRRCPDLTKIRMKLKYRPVYSLKEGIERTILWHRLQNSKQKI